MSSAWINNFLTTSTTPLRGSIYSIPFILQSSAHTLYAHTNDSVSNLPLHSVLFCASRDWLEAHILLAECRRRQSISTDQNKEIVSAAGMNFAQRTKVFPLACQGLVHVNWSKKSNTDLSARARAVHIFCQHRTLSVVIKSRCGFLFDVFSLGKDEDFYSSNLACFPFQCARQFEMEIKRARNKSELLCYCKFTFFSNQRPSCQLCRPTFLALAKANKKDLKPEWIMFFAALSVLPL